MARIPLPALGGMSLNVEIWGSGPHILAIHGFTGCAATWRSFAAAAREEFSVICVEMLGHGASDAPDRPERYCMTTTIMALKNILDMLEIERVHWLGYSMGGRIALGAALALGERTASLTLESASPGIPTRSERAARVRSDSGLADWTEKEGLDAFVRYWEALPLWASQARLPEAVRREIRSQRLANTAVGLANSLRGIGAGAQPSFHKQLAGLRMPTLFIAGLEDTKFVQIARQMSLQVLHSRLCVVPGAGHTVHLEKPELFNGEVLDFIRSTVSAPRAIRTVERSPQIR
ncbi:MAG: 2-succinyl-6-hydroxy-2,4-cyclohexadiene-1-carboxylate synthase [Dehalococcoidia bacterium]|nr:2-succinyl-6-hydroxy-2,4-cyclohexadiene-1-carboxylate synthase [Dehalococcoidia bacterium]